jgi:tetratricopeptide (TPR) repeat protein
LGNDSGAAIGKLAARVLVAVVVPLVFFLALELILRLVGLGFETRLFIPEPGGKPGALVANPRVGWRFFPPEIAREPQLTRFFMPKPEGTRRIFVLGGSAALGIPFEDFSVGRSLRAMLAIRFPGIRFEVISAAMTAINSHVLTAFAREIAGYDPDLVLVYTGNNEVVGPFGPSSVAGRLSESNALIQARIRLKSLRLVQVLEGLVRSLARRASGAEEQRWKGMEMFAESRLHPSDRRLRLVESHFVRNLERIVSSLRSADIPVVLCTVPTNLKDCPPFASENDPTLPEARLRTWRESFARGKRLAAKGELVQAAAQLRAALAADPSHAETAFRLAEVLARQGAWDEAAKLYIQARDADALPFRATSRLNAVIRETAARAASNGLTLVDLDEAFRRRSRHGVSDLEQFFEHVHLTYPGDLLAAGEIYRTVIERELLPLPGPTDEQREPPDALACMKFMAYTPWDEVRGLDSILQMMARPPFTGQPLFAGIRQALQARREMFAPLLTGEPMKETIETYRQAIARDPETWGLHARVAQIYLIQQQPRLAEQELRQVIERFPRHAALYNDLGIILAAQKRTREAVALFQRWIDNPDTPVDVREDLQRNLVGTLINEGLLDESGQRCREVLAQEGWSPELKVDLLLRQGEALQLAGRHEAALEPLQAALSVDPEHPLVHLRLGISLSELGRHAEAIQHLRKATELDPRSAVSFANLGLALLRNRRFEQAVEALNTAIRLDPSAPGPYNSMALALESTGKPREAIPYARKALELDPDRSEAYANLGRLLMRTGQYEQAVETLSTGASRAPTMNLLRDLAWVLATCPDERLRDAPRALRLAREAVTWSKRENILALWTLAEALELSGEHAEARRTLDEAMALARRQQNIDLLRRIQARAAELNAETP